MMMILLFSLGTSDKLNVQLIYIFKSERKYAITMIFDNDYNDNGYKKE